MSNNFLHENLENYAKNVLENRYNSDLLFQETTNQLVDILISSGFVNQDIIYLCDAAGNVALNYLANKNVRT